MLILYTVKLTIINNIINASIIFNKNFESEVTAADDILYDNYHILNSSVYVLDLFKSEIEDYCLSEGISTSDIVIDEYEIATVTENVEVFFENAIDINAFTLTPDIKCYVYPKEAPLSVPTLYGKAYDSTTIIWTWPDDMEYAHYLISEPVDFSTGKESTSVIAELPIGSSHYVETGLEPNTAYSRRLVNYTDTQTSMPSGEVTATTETVNPKVSLDKYFIEREQDWSITDSEREVIKEKLPAFHSGVGDFNDLKVYKQMDTDFYEKFKAYFTVTGKYTQRERRYEQVGFNYKICLEAKETIEEQEGEVTFKLDAYPWQEIYKTEYLWATQPITVYAKVFGTISIFGAGEKKKTISKKLTWYEQTLTPQDSLSNPTTFIISVDISSSMRFKGLGDIKRITNAKRGAKKFVQGIAAANFTDVQYIVTGFASKAWSVDCGSDAEKAIKIIDTLECGSTASGDGYVVGPAGGRHNVGNCTNWYVGLTDAETTASNPSAGNLIKKDSVAMMFFTDGFPNYYNGKLRAGTEYVTKSIRDGMRDCPADLMYAIFGCTPEYKDNDATTTPSYNRLVRGIITDNDKCKGSKSMVMDKATAEEIVDAFNEALEIFVNLPPLVGKVKKTKTIDVVVPWTNVTAKLVSIESRVLSFTFDSMKTFVGYNQETKRAEILNQLTSTKMDGESIKSLLTEAKLASPEWIPGVTTNPTVTDEFGVVSDVFTNIYIKDTFFFGSEDTPYFDFSEESPYEYGMMGSVNVYGDMPNLATADDYTDDNYVATDTSFVWISGSTEGIIYDGFRYGHTMVNNYSRPQETMFYTSDVPALLKNRMNKNYNYSGPVDSSSVFKQLLITKGPSPNYVQMIGNGIDQDLICRIDTHFESPVLNYRFNLLDPDAYTPYHEILPSSNPLSEDKNVIVLTVYFAKNVEIDSNYLNENYYGLFDYSSPAQNPLEFVYGLKATWNYATNTFDCDGKWITEYLHFFARKMTKTINYYDEIPGENMDSMYGLINGRYREDSLSGKQDLRVDTPQFNIPTTVLGAHADTIRIYPKITEVYPDTALVSFKWDNEYPVGSGFTKVNGDYITFSSDNLTYKDVEYFETIANYETEQIEMFSNDPLERLQSLTRVVGDSEYDNDLFYNYLNTDEWQLDCEISGDNSIQINQNGLLYGPFVTLPKGRYRVRIVGSNLNLATYECFTGATEIRTELEKRTDDEIIYRFSLFKETSQLEFKIGCIANAEYPVFVDGYFVGKTNGKYETYYLNVTTDNGDVLATRYPTEIVFDDKSECVVPVVYRGIVNATSKWSPRIHNGYYYINQHENFLYSEFDVKANFDKTEEIVFQDATVFVSFEVNLLKDGGPAQNYNINKNTIAELLQNEKAFMWSNENNGVTLKPVIEGWKYKHYEAKTWISPVILFQNPLTTAFGLTVSYLNTDGTNTGLDFSIRSFDLEKGAWTEWVPFVNGTVPNTSLSIGYQVKTMLTATETQTVYEEDDYLCCYLDWVDNLDMNLSKNIVIITDHITTDIDNKEGIVISKILDYSCESGIALSMYASSPSVAMQVAFSNNINDLILENAQWQPMQAANLNLGYKYYRFKIVIPVKQKIYWVHLRVKTLQTSVILPYIKGVQMSGVYMPEDITSSFSKLESFTIPKDGLFHQIIPKIGDVISSDVINKGFTLANITSLNITSTNPDTYLLFDNAILLSNFNTALLNTPVEAATSEATVDAITTLPYIFTENNKIKITGTPQQYCPIAVEDVDGNTFEQIYNVNPADMKLVEIHVIEKRENYIELKRTDFERTTLQIWINDILVDPNDYTIVNHLVLFKNNLEVNDSVIVSYNRENSFYAEINRTTNQTVITTYTNAITNLLPDEYTVDELTYKKKFKVMFETNMHNDKFVAKNLSLNPVYRTDYSGFIYLTEEHNLPHKIKIWCNPLRVKAGGLDTVDIQVEVLDIIGNPVIGKDINLDCKNGTLSAETEITDTNGVVHYVYQSSYLPTTDTLTAKVLLEDENINIQQTIEIISY